MSQIQEITNQNFSSLVVDSKEPFVLDFSATWCGPCRALEPVFERVAAEFAPKVKVGKVDIDAARSLAQQFNVRSVPTVISFKNGEVLDRMNGFDGTDRRLRELFNAVAS